MTVFGGSDAAPLVASIMFVAAVFMALQAAMGVLRKAQTETAINRRLKIKEKIGSAGALMVELRRQRGLTDDGDFALPLLWFARLVTRSGLVFRPVRWFAASGLAGAVLAAVVFIRFDALAIAIGAGVLVFLGAPVFVLNTLGAKRMKKLAQQLPDALQIVTRSLEAGHPVPTAISLVAREMPDPIGTEFGMAADEISYGASLATAIQRMAQRAGDPDIELFSATVRLQEKTGGNLCELLKANADTVRDRQTLRLKVKAASAEGRASAMILTAAPFIVVIGVHLMKPDFYGLVMHEPLFQKIVAGLCVWMFIGNMIMRNMINFKF